VPGETQTIVVVEDDASMSQALELILRAGGYEVVTFASAEAALEADAAATADFLVLDIHLPGMSGFDLYRQLALAGNELLAIFITAHDEPAVREEAEKLGARIYLPKPFSGRILLDVVRQALRSY
jgi:FixJ family two-component response regulator